LRTRISIGVRRPAKIASGGMPEDGRAYAEDALRRILASVPVPT
jgi:hypothetical protein